MSDELDIVGAGVEVLVGEVVADPGRRSREHGPSRIQKRCGGIPPLLRLSDRCRGLDVGEGVRSQRTQSSSTPSPSPLFYVRSATGAHNQELVGAPDQGAGSGGPPETKSLAVGRPLGSIQHSPP